MRAWMTFAAQTAKIVGIVGLIGHAACGSGDGGGTGDGPLYLVASWVADDSGAVTYVALVDNLDRDVDLAGAIEVVGYGDAWAYDEWVFVADGEAPTVTRYTVGPNNQLQPDRSISFLNYGLSAAPFFDNQILSRTKAYLANAAQREYVVWNPETMEITGTVPWPSLALETGLEPFHSYMDRGGEVVGGKFFHGIYQHNEDWNFFGSSSVIGVYDIASDALVDTIAVPCPMMDVASVGSDGYLYVSGWSYIPLSAELGLSPTNCAARIDVTTHVVDPAWTFDFTDVTGGHQGMAVRVREGNQGTIAVFLGSGVQVTPETDIWDLDAGDNDWEIYSIDLTTKAVTPTGTRMGSGSFYETHLGDGYFVYLQGNTDTQVYEHVNGSYQPRLKVRGWMSRLFRLR